MFLAAITFRPPQAASHSIHFSERSHGFECLFGDRLRRLRLGSIARIWVGILHLLQARERVSRARVFRGEVQTRPRYVRHNRVSYLLRISRPTLDPLLLSASSIVSNKVSTPHPMFYRPDRTGTYFRRDLIHTILYLPSGGVTRGMDQPVPYACFSLSEVATRFTPLVVAWSYREYWLLAPRVRLVLTQPQNERETSV